MPILVFHDKATHAKDHLLFSPGAQNSIDSEYGTIPALHKQTLDAIESGDADRAAESITILSSCVRNFLAT